MRKAALVTLMVAAAAVVFTGPWLVADTAVPPNSPEPTLLQPPLPDVTVRNDRGQDLDVEGTVPRGPNVGDPATANYPFPHPGAHAPKLKAAPPPTSFAGQTPATTYPNHYGVILKGLGSSGNDMWVAVLNERNTSTTPPVPIEGMLNRFHIDALPNHTYCIAFYHQIASGRAIRQENPYECVTCSQVTVCGVNPLCLE
jgi:hypothetical protein